MESIRSVSAAKAFGFGMALFVVQIKNLAIFVACLNLIAVASLSPLGSVVALGLVQMEGARYMRTSIVNRPCAAEEPHPGEQ
jgi:hypothetical protein